MKPENVMTAKEIAHYCTHYFIKNNIMLEFVKVFSNAIVIRNPRCNDLSKPGFALAYNIANNAIICTKIDNEWHPIIDDALEIKNNEVKDIETFIDFIGSINEYCIEHNCDYNTYINNKIAVNSHKEDNISIKCSRNRNQEIVYNQIDNFIRFLEVDDESKPIIDSRFKLDDTCSNFINENNFAEFAKESFEFCEENKCSFRNYAKKTVFNIIQLKSFINEFCNYRNPQKKSLYTFFDKDGKTAFTYYDDNTINAFKIIDDGKIFYCTIPGSSNSIKSNEEFKAFIKDNRTDIDEIVNKKLEEYKKQELERIRNANEDFDKSAREVKMNGKPKRTGRGI